MALTFNPVNVSLPAPQSYAGGKLGSDNTTLLSTLGDLTAIDSQQQALRKSEATFGADVAKAQADSQRAQTEAKRANVILGNEQMNSMYTVLTPYASDKRLLQAEALTNNSTPEQIKAVQNGLFDIGDEVKQKLKSMGWSNADAMTYVNDFNSSILKDPRQAPNDIKRATQSLAGALNISQQNQPQLATINGQTTTIVPSRGVVPLQGIQQPDASVSPTTETRGVTQGQMSMPPMQYPVRKAGDAYAQLPNEPKDLEDGRTFRSNLIQAQSDLPKMRRNVEEVLKEADLIEKNEWNQGAGFFGKKGRELSQFLGTEQGVRYKQLSKDLANAQITAIQASGGNLNTDAGKQLAKLANGDETYPPDVIKKIARRTQADMTNLDMQATAAQKFTNKYGDQNINTFKQLWSQNADSKMFELKNIFANPNLSKEEKEAARNELLGTNKETLKEYTRKWENIQKLEKTGSL